MGGTIFFSERWSACNNLTLVTSALLLIVHRMLLVFSAAETHVIQICKHFMIHVL